MNEELQRKLREAESLRGLPEGLLSSIVQQETGGKPEYLADPTKYHYDLNEQDKRIAGHTGKVSTAFGPFGILESTAADPGFGVKPLASKDIDEQIRFAADYLSARIKQAGSVEAGLAGYGEGKKYSDKVLSRLGAPAMLAADGKLAKLAQQTSITVQPGEVRSLDITGAVSSAVETTEAAAAARRAEETATAAEAAKYGMETSWGMRILRDIAGGPIDSWQPSDEDRKMLVESGVLRDGADAAYINGYHNQGDFLLRVEEVKERRRTVERLSNAVGVQGLVNAAAVMGGSLADPIGVATAVAGGAMVPIIRGTQVASRIGRIAASAGAAFGSEAALAATAMAMDSSEVAWGEVLVSGLFGASLDLPLASLGQTLAAGRMSRAAGEFRQSGEALAAAVDTGAADDVVAELQAGLNSARDRLVQQALEEGDRDAALLWAQAGPDATAADISAALSRIKRERAQAHMLPEGEVRDLFAPQEARPEGKLVDEATRHIETASGLRMSQYAASVHDYAYKVWDDAVEVERANLHRRTVEWYNFRKERAKDYAGLSQWLDSPGLTLQLSNSRVVRMLGAHLAESGTGIGKREVTVDLDYEQTHAQLVYGNVEKLKEMQHAWMDTGTKWRHYMGGGATAEQAFARVVAEERLLRRQHVASGESLDTFVSNNPPAVQRAARLMDDFWRDAAKRLKGAGIEEGDAILKGGAVGHIPYRWNFSKLTKDFVENPERFASLARLLRGEFHNKVLNPALDAFNDAAPKMLEARRGELEGRVAQLQDEIADMEQVMQQLNQVRDEVRTATADIQQVRAIRKELREREKALQAELKELEALEAQAKKQAKKATPVSDNLVVQLTHFSKKKITEYRNNKAFKETTSTDILDELEKAPWLSPAEKAIVAALRSDMDVAGPIPVFVGQAPASFFAHDGFLVLNTGGARWQDGAMTVLGARVAMHELIHARTSNWITAFERGVEVPPRVAEAIGMLDNVLAILRDTHADKVGQEFGVGYAMQNRHELLAQVANDFTVRDALAAIDLGEGRSLLRVVWEAVAKALGLETRTGLSDVLQVISDLSSFHVQFVRANGEIINFAPSRAAEIRGQLDATKQQGDELDARLRSMRERREAVQEGAHMVQQASKVKELRAKELQLNNAKARLSDMQADPLSWWGREVKKLRTAAEEKADSLTSAYLKRVMQSPDEKEGSVLTHFADLAESLLNENWLGDRVSPEMAEEFRKLLSDKIGDRSRTEFDLLKQDNGVSMLDYFDLDPIAQVKTHAHRVAGWAALGKRGFTDTQKIDGALEAARLDGASEQEREQLKFLFDFYSGNLKGKDHAALHALRNGTYAAYMGKLGMSMLADIPQISSTLGMGNMLKVMGNMARQVLDGSLFLTKEGKLTPLGMQLSKQAPSLLGKNHRVMSMVPEDVATGEALSAGSRLQRVTARGAQLTSYLSLANGVNMAMHRAFVPILAEEVLEKIMRGKSALTDERFADLGLTGEKLQRVQAMLMKHNAGRKVGDDIDFDAWEDQYAVEVLMQAFHRGTYQTLHKAMRGETPAWTQNSEIGRLVGQFRGFGLTAAEKVSVRNLAHGDGNAYVSMALGLAWASLMWSARVHANSAGRDDKEQYIKDQLTGWNMVRGVLVMWNASGISADVGSILHVLFGGEQVQTASPAAALGFMTDVAKAGAGAGSIVTGQGDAGDVRSIVRILPGGNSLLGTYLQNELMKE